MKNGSEYDLVVVRSVKGWETYHRIRREELFEAKGRPGIYDPARPEERSPNNLPLLLRWGSEGIGTTRLDVRKDNTAVVRLVAITKAKQGNGHGRVLAERVEELARQIGMKKLVVNADPKAAGYYKKLGFAPESWDPSELVGISADAIQMSKVLA